MATAPIKLRIENGSCTFDGSSNPKKLSAGTVFPKLLEKIVQGWKKRQQQRIDRDAFDNLLRLDERELDDIGLKREDVLWASKLPLSFNASNELQRIKNL